MAEAERLGAPWPGAIAVSGGGDSLALMLLLAKWANARKAVVPVVLTVDHGLRPNSANDARLVIENARTVGLKAQILRWRGAKPSRDIEAAARDARYRLMGAWCGKHRVSGLYLAHTLEDQAETFLLRLARGSGIDGLSAMKSVAPLPSRECEGVVVVRPLLDFRREALRDYLIERGKAWVEDPMNKDPRFARARVRAAWPVLESIGLTPARITAASGHLARARQALDCDTQVLIAAACRTTRRGVLFDAARLAKAPREIGLRALASILMRVSTRDYRPRFERLERLYTPICEGRLRSGRTLHGCRIAPAKKQDALFGPTTLFVTCENVAIRRRGTLKNDKTAGQTGRN